MADKTVTYLEDIDGNGNLQAIAKALETVLGPRNVAIGPITNDVYAQNPETKALFVFCSLAHKLCDK